MIQLRPYQKEMRDAVLREWESVCATLVVAPTGAGKTVLFASLIQSVHPKRALVIAERRELIYQACDKIRRVTGLECGIEMADSFVNKSLFGEMPVVVSTIQTQISSFGDRRRMSRFHPKDFGVLVIDECVTGDTLITMADGSERRIDAIFASGESVEVLTFNIVENRIRANRIYGRKKSKSALLVTITMADGSVITATPEHPVLTARGYIPISCLTTKDSVLKLKSDGRGPGVKAVQILSVEEAVGGADVFDIAVEANHNYFANGTLVHNCHHSTAKSYRDLINYYRKWNPEIKIVGVTACPDRADEEALGQVFDTVAFDYEILDAIHDGWLVPIHQQFVQTKADFSHIRTTAGDLNGADLAAVMEAEENMQAVTGASIEIIGQRRALVFTASVKQAEMVANIFNRHRAGTADWVCGKTNEEKRAELLRRFQNGDIQVMANCNCLSEGYDDPGVHVVIQARPTKSRSLYAQQIGRCARPLPGVVDGPETAELRKAAIAASAKPNCEVVDFVGNSGKHKLMTTADILGGKVSEEVVRIAIAKSKNTGGDMVKAIDETLEEMEKARLAEEARKARLVARVQYSSKHISPFDALDIEPVKERGWDNNKRLTDKQLAMLRRNGVNADKMPYGQAKQLLIAMFARMDNKMATLKQCSLLKKFGYETKYLKMSDATKLIDALKANNWNKPAERTHETTVQNA